MKLLFDPEDHFCYGSFFSTQTIGYCDHALKGLSYTQYDKKGEGRLHTTEYLAMNPIKEYHTRSINGVSKFRTFLFESDSVPLGYQTRVIAYAKKYHNFPVSTLTFSGNKSKHALIVLETPIGIDSSYLSIPDVTYDYRPPEAVIYTTIHRMVVAKLNNIVDEMRNLPSDNKNHLPVMKKPNYFDTNVKDSSRLTRFPNGTNTKHRKGRWDVPTKSLIYTQNNQKVDFVGKRISYEVFLKFLKTCPYLEHDVLQAPKPRDPLLATVNQISNVAEFQALCSSETRDFIDSFKNNSQPDGMYGVIKAYLYQVHNEFPDIDEQLLYEIYLKTIYPYLEAVKYKSLQSIHPQRNSIFRTILRGKV